MPEFQIANEVYKILGIGGLAALAVYVTVRYLLLWVRKAQEEMVATIRAMQDNFDKRYDAAQTLWLAKLDQMSLRWETRYESIEKEVRSLGDKMDEWGDK